MDNLSDKINLVSDNSDKIARIADDTSKIVESGMTSIQELKGNAEKYSSDNKSGYRRNYKT